MAAGPGRSVGSRAAFGLILWRLCGEFLAFDTGPLRYAG